MLTLLTASERIGNVENGTPVALFRKKIQSLEEENAKLKQELQDAWDILAIQREAASKREACPLCKMNEPPLRGKDAKR